MIYCTQYGDWVLLENAYFVWIVDLFVKKILN